MRFHRKIRIFPSDDATSGWTATLDPLPPARRLARRETADAVIVGAGLTGLAVARRLSELRPDWRVAIVEAQRVGAGASGRASGFVVDLTDAAALMKPAARDRYVALARLGIDHLRSLVREHEVDCDWDETGWIRAAAGPEGKSCLDALPTHYEELGITYERLDADALAAITGSTFYRHGLRLPGYPLVQSGALVRGMARVLPENVELFEDSPVRRIEGGGRFRITTDGGSLEAPKLFLATNGYTPALGFLERRVFPLFTFGSMTRPLTDGEQETLGGESQWGILAMDPMGSTVRRTRDQRLLVRNWSYYDKTLKISDAVRRQSREYHRRAFDARFPMLGDVEFEYTWAGLMGAAYNSMISFEEPKPDLYVASTYTAAGIAMSQAAGRLLVEHALGLDTDDVRFVRSLPKPTWMPPEPFRSIGGRWLTERKNALAGDYL